MLNADDKERGFLEVRADKMVLLVNNLGPLSALELGAIVTEVADQLRKTYSVALARVYAGTYMTSLDGPGFSISLLNIVGTERYFSCLTRQAKLWGWPTSISGETWGSKWNHVVNGSSASTQIGDCEPGKLSCDMGVVVRRLRNGLNAMVAAEPEVTNTIASSETVIAGQHSSPGGKVLITSMALILVSCDELTRN